jgi:hypothetical protein
MSVCQSTWNTPAPLSRNLIWVLFENLPRKFKFHSNLTRKIGTLREGQYTFLIISHSILRMSNVSDKTCRENKKSHIFFLPKIAPLWEIVEKYARTGQVADGIWLMCIACRTTKAKNTQSEYVILGAFPLQQCLCNHVSMLNYTYNACLVYNTFFITVLSIRNCMWPHCWEYIIDERDTITISS